MNPQFTILNPCPKRWSDLVPDPSTARKRFCDNCQRDIHDHAQYSPQEWAQLWRESGRNVCGLLYPDPIPEPPLSRRLMLMGALLSFVSPLFGQSGSVKIHTEDGTKAPIRGARIELLDRDGKPIREQKTDENGDATFGDLSLGIQKSRVSSQGFVTAESSVIIDGGGPVSMRVALVVGTVGGYVYVVEPEQVPMRDLPDEVRNPAPPSAKTHSIEHAPP